MRHYKILVTGANGFVGRFLCTALLDRGHEVRAAVRDNDAIVASISELEPVGDINEDTDWREALVGVDIVIHLAARVHIMSDTVTDSLEEFRRVNVRGTLNLASQAVVKGVRRFIFVSSIKVNGETSVLGRPFTAEDRPAPLDSYSVSKMEAEYGLREIEHQTDMEVVIVRPPLIYGPGVKANFATMMRWIRLGVPLPFGAIHNKRSLVSLDNLVDLLMRCVTHPGAAGQTFLVSDGEDVSTTELLFRMGQALDRSVCLIPVPVYWLKLMAALVGRKDIAQRLCESLQVDITKTKRMLDWEPSVSLDDGMKKTRKWI